METLEAHKALVRSLFERRNAQLFERVRREFIAYPKTSGRGSVSPDVSAKHADDYTEACLVLPDSPKASTALSRRVLQNLLRGEGGAKPGSLADEIKQVLPKLPSYLQYIDAIRHIGNFSAHPLKDTNTGDHRRGTRRSRLAAGYDRGAVRLLLRSTGSREEEDRRFEQEADRRRQASYALSG